MSSSQSARSFRKDQKEVLLSDERTQVSPQENVKIGLSCSDANSSVSVSTYGTIIYWIDYVSTHFMLNNTYILLPFTYNRKPALNLSLQRSVLFQS